MNLITRRALLKLGLSGAALAALSGEAAALVQVIVSGANFRPLPIAIPDFASSDPVFGHDVAEIVRNNLRRSGLFAPLEIGRMPATVGDVNAAPDFTAWRGVQAEALVMGAVERGGVIQASMRVYDALEGQQMVGRTYSTDASAWRRIGHIVSDAIYEALAGETGYFDTQVVYVAESGPKANRVKRLAIMDQDGANVQYLTQGRSLVLTPRFSPSSDTLAYMNFDGGNPQVYLLQLSTGQQQRLGDFGRTFSPRFCPDGRRIAFSVEQSGSTNIFTYDVASGQAAQLTSGAAIDTAPSFSPDGGSIVFESDRGGSQQIYVMGAGGGGAQRISYGAGAYSTPVWSPKGNLIAFTRQAEGAFQIGIMNPDGSGERVLASSFHAEGPTWWPNGRVIMFFRDPGGNDGPRLYSVDIWGRNEQEVPTESYASDPAWSPLRA